MTPPPIVIIIVGKNKPSGKAAHITTKRTIKQLTSVVMRKVQKQITSARPFNKSITKEYPYIVYAIATGMFL